MWAPASWPSGRSASHRRASRGKGIVCHEQEKDTRVHSTGKAIVYDQVELGGMRTRVIYDAGVFNTQGALALESTIFDPL